MLTRVLLIAIVVVISGACGAGSLGAKFTPAPLPTGVVLRVDTNDSATANVDVGVAPKDLRQMDWSKATIPAFFCGVSTPASLVSGHAESVSETWGVVELAVFDIAYGDVLDDENFEAAVLVDCSNGGGTGSGRLASGIVLFAERNGRLIGIDTITAQKQTEGNMPTLISVKAWRKPTIVISEYYFRELDSTCCPSGEAETDWTWTGESLVPGATRVIE